MTSSLDSATKLALLNLADHLGDEVGQVGAIVARLGTGLFNDIAAEVVLPPSEVSGRDRLADQVAAQKRELVQRALLVMITHGIVKTNTDPDGVRYEFVVERAVMRLRFPYFVKHVRREMCCFVPAAAMDSRRGAYDDVAARLVRVLLLHGRLQQPTLLRFVEEDLLRQSRERREAGDAAASSVPSDDEAELRAVLQETFDELFRRRYFRYFGDGDGGDLDEDSDSSAKRRHESSSAASRKRARSVREDLARMERYDQQLSCEAFSLPLEINVEQLNDELLVQQCLRFARLRPSSTVDASELLLEEEGSGEEEEEGESEEEEEEEEEVAPRGRAASMATQGADAAVAGSIELTLSAIFSIVGGLAGAFKQARGDEEYGGGYGDDGVSFKVTTLRKEIKNRAHAAQVELDRIKSLQGSASYSAEEEGSSSSGGGGGSSSADIDALREARKVLLRRRVKFGTLQVRDVDRLCSRLAKIEVVGNAGDVPVMEDSESHFRNQSQQSSDDMMRRRGILYNIGNKLWALNVMKLLNCMHEFSIESVVRGKFGVHSARIFRFLAQQGYLDDDAVSASFSLSFSHTPTPPHPLRARHTPVCALKKWRGEERNQFKLSPPKGAATLVLVASKLSRSRTSLSLSYCPSVSGCAGDEITHD